MNSMRLQSWTQWTTAMEEMEDESERNWNPRRKNKEESSLMQFSCLEMCWKLNQTIKKQKTLMSEAREELKTMDEEEMKARKKCVIPFFFLVFFSQWVVGEEFLWKFPSFERCF